MKQNLIVSAAIVLLLLACNNDKKVVATSEDGKTTTTINAENLEKASSDLQDRTNELKKLTPYTLDEMKAILPEELAGGKRSKFSANSAMGAAFAAAEYTINDTTNIELSVFDCAGEAGAGIYNMQYFAMMNFQSESDDEYTKTIDFNGSRAIEHVEKQSNRSSLTWPAADRLLVTLKGENTGLDVLKQAAGSLKLK